MNRNKNVSKLELIERRGLVYTLVASGLKAHEIWKKLAPTKEEIQKAALRGEKLTNYYENKGYKNPYGVLEKDIEVAKKKQKKLLLDGQIDDARADFIAQQLTIFTRALASKRYSEAITASENIALARGVDIKKVPQILGDVIVGKKIQQDAIQILQPVLESISSDARIELLKALENESNYSSTP
jgi:predicted Zn-dependent protease